MAHDRREEVVGARGEARRLLVRRHRRLDDAEPPDAEVPRNPGDRAEVPGVLRPDQNEVERRRQARPV
jgi:hypothetical protein